MTANLKKLFQITSFALCVNLSIALNVLADDEYVVDLYETYCQACHSIEGTGAPISFDTTAWNEVLQRGKEAVLNNAVTGVRNMPAQGGCMECTYEDLEDLLIYMSSPKSD